VGGHDNPARALDADRLRPAEAIRHRDRDGEIVREITRSYNVSHSTISRLTV
jgi:hypothetical protein